MLHCFVVVTVFVKWGFSPLHFAAFTGNKPIVSALLSHGASTNIKSVVMARQHHAMTSSANFIKQSGTSPTDIAKELNFVDVLTLLMSKTKIDEGLSIFHLYLHLHSFLFPHMRLCCSDPNTPKFRAWLNHLGGGEFIQKFFDAGYDLAFVAKSGLDDRDLDCVGIPMSKLGLRKKLLSLHDLDRFYVPGEEEEEEDGDDEDEGEEEDDEGEEEDEGDEEDDD